MQQVAVSESIPADREMASTIPETGTTSKRVMLRAERGDALIVTETRDIVPGIQCPDRFTVKTRHDTYYGPDLILEADSEEYRVTAPGPDTDLLLWKSMVDESGAQIRWRKLAEVVLDFADDTPPYTICSNCGDPIRTAEHERLSALNRCKALK